MIGRRRSLGLALDERRIVAAQVVSAGGRCSVGRVGEFVLPDGLTWDSPREVGERLGPWLRERGFAREAVFGLPAQWLVTASRAVPPVTGQLLVGVLRLAAERAFSIPVDQMVCDCASVPSDGQAGTALLVGARRDRVDACREVARAAGLKVGAVTSTTAVLALLAAPGPSGGVAVQLLPGALEAAIAVDGRLRAIRHQPLPGTSGSPDAGALHLGLRAVLTAANVDAERIRLYDAVGIGADVAEEAGQRLALSISCDPALPVAGLGESAADAHLPPGRAAPAAGLALAGLGRLPLPFDLAAPRLTRGEARPWGRWAAWAAFLLVALLVAVVAFVADRSARKGEAHELRAKLDEMAPSIAAAEEIVDTVRLARGWYDRRPPFLDCLVGLTLAFPEAGRIWATSLAVKEDMRGVVSGKSADEQSVLDVLDALKESSGFAQVKLLYLRETRGAAGDTAFAIAFTYAGQEQR